MVWPLPASQSSLYALVALVLVIFILWAHHTLFRHRAVTHAVSSTWNTLSFSLYLVNTQHRFLMEPALATLNKTKALVTAKILYICFGVIWSLLLLLLGYKLFEGRICFCFCSLGITNIQKHFLAHADIW